MRTFMAAVQHIWHSRLFYRIALLLACLWLILMIMAYATLEAHSPGVAEGTAHVVVLIDRV